MRKCLMRTLLKPLNMNDVSSKSTPVFCVWAPVTIASYYLTQHLVSLQTLYPGIQVFMKTWDTGEIIDNLHELDLSFIEGLADLADLGANYQVIPWQNDEIVLPVHIKGFNFPVLLAKRASNKDGSAGLLVWRQATSNSLTPPHDTLSKTLERRSLPQIHQIQHRLGTFTGPHHPHPEQPLFCIHLRFFRARTTQAEASAQPFRPQKQALPQSLASQFR